MHASLNTLPFVWFHKHILYVSIVYLICTIYVSRIISNVKTIYQEGSFVLN